MADATQGGAPKRKLSTQEILAAARAEAGQAAPAGVESTVGEAAGVPASEAVSVQAPAVEKTGGEKTGGEKTQVVEKRAPPAAGVGPKSTSDILARARAEAAQKAAGAAPAAAESAAPAESKKPAAAKPAPGGAKSTADILAAARAAAGGKPAAAPAPGAAAVKPAAKEKPAAAAKAAAVTDDSGSKLSVQEMLAAVRPGAAPVVPKVEAATGPPPAPQKPLPSKKPAAAAPQPQLGYFAAGMATAIAILASPFFLAWTLLAATTAIAGLATARFMLPNVLAEPPSKFKIGPPTDFDLGTVATKLVAQYGVWIVHTDQYQGKNLIYALISVCTHLGCTPSWLEGEQKFKCPCHGSGFYITGINFEGPAPRPLERAAIRLAPDGMLEVDKSVKFQEEMGQWADPTSYFEVVA